MEIRVVCGDPDCREEFPVSTEDPKWECPNCGRIIVNRKYPFLTAKLMQANIDKDTTEWKEMVADLLDQAREQVEKRVSGDEGVPDLSFLENAERKLGSEEDLSNSEWKDYYEDLFRRARDTVLELDEKNSKN